MSHVLYTCNRESVKSLQSVSVDMLHVYCRLVVINATRLLLSCCDHSDGCTQAWVAVSLSTCWTA